LNKKFMEKLLLQRMVIRFLLAAVVSLGIIVGGSFLGYLLCSFIPIIGSIKALIWIGDRILFVGIAVFLFSVFIILLVQWKQLISYLAEISSVIETIGEREYADIKLSSVLRETQDSIVNVSNKIKFSAIATREAEQRKNDLVVYLAHDLKTPISSIIGYLTLLRDEKQISQELQNRYIQTALNNSEKLDDLINEFFEITRFNLSHITLEYSNISLTRLMEQLVFDFQPMLTEKELSCRLDIPDNLILHCDADKIQRVFENLLYNAVNYSFENSEIYIASSILENSVILSLENSGNTIPMEKLERIFEQFYRLDSSRSSRTGGSGLGLAIAKEIVELHHGTITASSYDQKVNFTVTLPLS